MAVIVKRWDDAGAPVLNGVAGSLIAVLDAVLVTAAGWTKDFSGTNLAAYRAPVGGNRFYLRVDDSAGTSARVVGYESMTDVNTGTGPFPTGPQLAGGAYVVKADSTATTARQWVIAVSDRLFHMHIHTQATAATASIYGVMWSFGDIKSLVSGDGYGTMLLAHNSTTYSGNQYPLQTSNAPAHYIARPYTGIGGSIPFAKSGDPLSVGSNAIGAYGLIYPNPDGGVYIAPLKITESGALRGTIPGVWQLLHPLASMQHLDTFSGSGAFAGRTFINLQQQPSAGILLETSNTWDI